jgi:CxxC motif-containing protein (DUF1111 family)
MYKKSFFTLAAVGIFLGIFTACNGFVPNNDQILDGPLEDLSANENAQHSRGDIAFNDNVFTSTNGLGPIFVATSCGSCHAGDGKGHPFTSLTRFGQIDSNGNQYLAMGGPQLQNHALPGYAPEVIPAGATSAIFLPPAVTGLGFLDAVSDADIIAMSDPGDANADGISGVPNWIHIPEYMVLRAGAINSGNRYIGRFGMKAGAYNLLMQTVNAYNQDMGINSIYSPYDTYSGNEMDPEVPVNTVNDVVFYLMTLKAPIQRDQNNADVISGKQIFISLGCENCHKQQLQTGISPIAALSNKTFAPYTDLLMHDLGPGLDDGYTEGTALTSEWRTAPLWGIGLAKNSQGGSYFLLHDGRAHSLEEAILLHGGEASASSSAYQALNQTDKTNLIKFLESL